MNPFVSLCLTVLPPPPRVATGCSAGASLPAQHCCPPQRLEGPVWPAGPGWTLPHKHHRPTANGQGTTDTRMLSPTCICITTMIVVQRFWSHEPRLVCSLVPPWVDRKGPTPNCRSRLPSCCHCCCCCPSTGGPGVPPQPGPHCEREGVRTLPGGWVWVSLLAEHVTD